MNEIAKGSEQMPAASLPDLFDMEWFRYDVLGFHYACGCIVGEDDEWYPVTVHTCLAHRVAWHRGWVATLAGWGRNHDASVSCPLGVRCPKVAVVEVNPPF